MSSLSSGGECDDNGLDDELWRGSFTVPHQSVSLFGSVVGMGDFNDVELGLIASVQLGMNS